MFAASLTTNQEKVDLVTYLCARGADVNARSNVSDEFISAESGVGIRVACAAWEMCDPSCKSWPLRHQNDRSIVETRSQLVHSHQRT